MALCRCYGLEPFRYSRMHSQTLIALVPESFVKTVLWPEFEQLTEALRSHLSGITDRIIREEVHNETREAEERRLWRPCGVNASGFSSWWKNSETSAIPTDMI